MSEKRQATAICRSGCLHSGVSLFVRSTIYIKDLLQIRTHAEALSFQLSI